MYIGVNMFQLLTKKTFTGLITLLLAFCSFCLGSGVNALASEVGIHHAVTHEHEGAHDDHFSSQQEDGEGASVTCCNDNQNSEAIRANDGHDDVFDLDCDDSCDAWQEENDFLFDPLEHYVEPHSPPDDTKRRESERDSTKLRL